MWVWSLGQSGRSPEGGNGSPLQYSCLEKSHRQSSLVGHGPQGCKELDMTEATWHVQLSVTPWTVACQALLSMEFSRQEYWSGLPFSTPRDLRDPGIEPISHVSPAWAGRFLTTLPPGKPIFKVIEIKLFIPSSCYLLICATSIDIFFFISTTVYWVFLLSLMDIPRYVISISLFTEWTFGFIDACIFVSVSWILIFTFIISFLLLSLGWFWESLTLRTDIWDIEYKSVVFKLCCAEDPGIFFGRGVVVSEATIQSSSLLPTAVATKKAQLFSSK